MLNRSDSITSSAISEPGALHLDSRVVFVSWYLHLSASLVIGG